MLRATKFIRIVSFTLLIFLPLVMSVEAQNPGVPVEVGQFLGLALRQVPVDVVLMIDTSSSVATYLDDFSRAVEEFAQKLEPEDRISLIKFDDRVELVQDWTQSRFQLRRALRRITPGMFTRFNDALFLAAREQLGRARVRHAILVLTDGIDSGRGNSTIETALRELLKAGVSVYVVSNTQIEQARKRAELDSLLTSTESVMKFNELRIGDLSESLRVLDLSEHSLGKLAEATGGRLYTPESFDKLDSVYREVAEELRHQYALYYTPLDKARDGRFRRVKVDTTDPALRITTRVGYYAPRNLSRQHVITDTPLAAHPPGDVKQLVIDGLPTQVFIARR